MTVIPFKPHSGTKPASGAAAELRFTQKAYTHTHPDWRSPAASPEAAGTFARKVGDAFTVLVALVVFGAIAWFFWVLA